MDRKLNSPPQVSHTPAGSTALMCFPQVNIIHTISSGYVNTPPFCVSVWTRSSKESHTSFVALQDTVWYVYTWWFSTERLICTFCFLTSTHLFHYRKGRPPWLLVVTTIAVYILYLILQQILLEQLLCQECDRRTHAVSVYSAAKLRVSHTMRDCNIISSCTWHK